ncbi:MAG: phosphatase PAP2 family protein [Gammaproteobacteria bacterium]
MDKLELGLCQSLNQYSDIELIRVFFSLISRLGNGVFWYILMLLLPVAYGWSAIETSINMLVTGLIGVAVYKLLKTTLVRQRPYIQHSSIVQGTEALDYYSFPSGHTLHAFSFSLIAINSYPELALVLVPFTLLVAMSRVVLGLHYPTDVLVGAALGSSLAMMAIV